MDFNKMMAEAMKQVMFQAENRVFNTLIAENAGDMDATTYMQVQNIIAAFNRRGVSTKIVLDVFKEAFGGGANE